MAFAFERHSTLCRSTLSSMTPRSQDNAYQQKVRKLWTALSVLTGFSLLEVSVSGWSHSLSLVADAGHVFSDAAALGLSLLATWLGQRARSQAQTSSIETLAACVNGLSLVAISAGVIIAAIQRLQTVEIPEVFGLPMLIMACISLGINSWNAFCLQACSHHDLNMRSAFLHVLADLFGSLGTIVAAIVITGWGYTWVDGVISILTAGLILSFAIPLLAQSLLALQRRTAVTLNSICQCSQSKAEQLLFPSLEDILL
jgi:cobalt-zinc-cadmium efflux system protein